MLIIALLRVGNIPKPSLFKEGVLPWFSAVILLMKNEKLKDYIIK